MMKTTSYIFIFGAVAASFSLPVRGQEIHREINPVDVSVTTDLGDKATKVFPTAPVKHSTSFASWSAPLANRIPPISIWSPRPARVEIDSDAIPSPQWTKFGSTPLPATKLLGLSADQSDREKQRLQLDFSPKGTPRSVVVRSSERPSPAQQDVAFPQTKSSLVTTPAFKKSSFESVNPSFLRKPSSTKMRTSTTQSDLNKQGTSANVGTTP
jgi:hypothetical protein